MMIIIPQTLRVSFISQQMWNVVASASLGITPVDVKRIAQLRNGSYNHYMRPFAVLRRGHRPEATLAVSSDGTMKIFCEE